MPLEMIEVTDQLTGLITFKTSPVYEMIISLRTLLQSSRHADWVARMRETLPPTFWDELHDQLDGIYLSFDTDPRPERITDAFPPRTLARLRDLKRRYDPDDRLTSLYDKAVKRR